MEYELSNEVEKIANKLIKQFHDELKPKKIVYVTQTRKDKETGEAQAQMRKGRPVLADIKIVGGLNAFLVSGEARTDENGPVPFAVMVVSKHAWNKLKPKQREAMIDEQLSRLVYDDETGRPSLEGYDLEAMTLNVKRFGAWNHDLDRFLKLADEFPLFADLDDLPPTASEEAKQQAKILKGGNAEGSNGADGDYQKDLVEKAGETEGKLPDFKQEVEQKRGVVH